MCNFWFHIVSFCFIQIVLQKFPELCVKDFNAYTCITRWFSNADERDGGKRDRLRKEG